MTVPQSVLEALGSHEDVLCAFEMGDKRASLDDVRASRAALVAAIANAIAQRRSTPMPKHDLAEVLEEAVEGLEYLQCFIADYKIKCDPAFVQRWVDAEAAARDALAATRR